MEPANEGTIDEERKKLVIICAAAAAAATAAVADFADNYLTKEPYRDEALRGWKETQRIISVSDHTCRAQIRMNRNAFFRLSALVREMGLLTDSRHVTLEEQLCIFLCTIGHNEKNRKVLHNFGRSGQTVSHYFNIAVNAIVKLYPVLVPSPNTRTHEKIRDHPGQYFPYFKDCIGAIDGTHVPAWVPTKDHPRFRDRKGNISQNVLAACDFDMNFTYVLGGWEGSASDSRILNDAINRQGAAKLAVPNGKYYLVDAGFANQIGFLRPYRNVRYHLKEWRNSNQSPTNKKELFNMRHSHLRNVIERSFGLLKSRFNILKNAPEYPIRTQVKIVNACILMHNLIITHGRMPDDERFFAMEEARQVRTAPAPRTARGEESSGDDEDLEMSSDDEEENVTMDDWDQFRDDLATQMWNDWVVSGEVDNAVISD